MTDIHRATFGGGCFWGVQAIFQKQPGVSRVLSGYMGGETENPTYQDICTGTTGHAEVVQIEFDPSLVLFETLLEIFYRLHDPTTMNRQGVDTGSQYRSVIYFHSADQKKQSEVFFEKLKTHQVFSDPVVTELTEAPTFYVAEEYHQDYFNKNGGALCHTLRPPLFSE